MLTAAGFINIEIRIKEESREVIKQWMPGSGAEDFVVSAEVTADKPVGDGTPPAPKPDWAPPNTEACCPPDSADACCPPGST